MMKHEEFEKVLKESGMYDDMIYERVLSDLVLYELNLVNNVPECEFDLRMYMREKAHYISDHLKDRGWYDRTFQEYKDQEEKIAAKWYKVQIWGSKDDENICTTFGTYPDITEWAYNKMKEIDGKAIFIKEITREEVLS